MEVQDKRFEGSLLLLFVVAVDFIEEEERFEISGV
jgi:hypothetical protein